MGLTHRVDADSDSREHIPTADSPFYCFSTPPFRLSFHLCLPRCTGYWDSPGPVRRGLRSGLASEALRVVLCGVVVLPLFAQGQHAMPSISSSPQARRGGGSSWKLLGQYRALQRGDGTTHDQFTGAGSFCILIRVPSDSNDTVHAYILYDRTHRCAQQLQHRTYNNDHACRAGRSPVRAQTTAREWGRGSRAGDLSGRVIK